MRHGDKRGRDLGFPTANLRLDPDCGLRHGIYAVRVARRRQAPYDGVASFGRRPTFDNGAPLLEVYLFDFAGDLYGRRWTSSSSAGSGLLPDASGYLGGDGVSLATSLRHVNARRTAQRAREPR